MIRRLRLTFSKSEVSQQCSPVTISINSFLGPIDGKKNFWIKNSLLFNIVNVFFKKIKFKDIDLVYFK